MSMSSSTVIQSWRLWHETADKWQDSPSHSCCRPKNSNFPFPAQSMNLTKELYGMALWHSPISFLVIRMYATITQNCAYCHSGPLRSRPVWNILLAIKGRSTFFRHSRLDSLLHQTENQFKCNVSQNQKKYPQNNLTPCPVQSQSITSFENTFQPDCRHLPAWNNFFRRPCRCTSLTSPELVLLKGRIIIVIIVLPSSRKTIFKEKFFSTIKSHPLASLHCLLLNCNLSLPQWQVDLILTLKVRLLHVHQVFWFSSQPPNKHPRRCLYRPSPQLLQITRARS